MPFSRIEYRRRAFDCLSRANATDDPEKRAEMLQTARLWMGLFEPLEDMPGHFELPKRKAD